MTTAYPLAWPQGFPRTKSRVPSRFKTTTHQAVNNVRDELRRFGNDTGRKVEQLVISSNVTLVVTRPPDPGIAAYFLWDGVQCCIAVDRYTTPAENLQAVSLIVEAERAKMRHGGLNIVRASFRGFASLPPPDEKAGEIEAPWRSVLGVTDGATLIDAKSAYFKLVKEQHPDVGGDAARFNLVVNAWRKAQEELHP